MSNDAKDEPRLRQQRDADCQVHDVDERGMSRGILAS
jgi:hypothetical protein